MRLDPAEAEAIRGRRPEREVRILLDDPGVDVTWSRFAGGERGAEPHVHHRHVDGFYVLEGEVTFTVGPDAERVTAGPGTAVLVPPGVVHAFDIDGEAATTYLNFHAPSTGFAAYLRGERDGFDSTAPPADGGRPADDVLLDTSGVASLDGLTLEVSGVPAARHVDLGAGRFLNVRVG